MRPRRGSSSPSPSAGWLRSGILTGIPVADAMVFLDILDTKE